MSQIQALNLAVKICEGAKESHNYHLNYQSRIIILASLFLRLIILTICVFDLDVVIGISATIQVNILEIVFALLK